MGSQSWRRSFLLAGESRHQPPGAVWRGAGAFARLSAGRPVGITIEVVPKVPIVPVVQNVPLRVGSEVPRDPKRWNFWSLWNNWNRNEFHACRLMPSFSMRERNVLGIDAEQLRRAFFAVNHPIGFAQRAQDVIALVVFQRIDGRRLPPPRSRCAAANRRLAPPGRVASTTARSMTFCSSRMLPGQL